jgi:DNA-binding NarL/FixJ family response regulator
VLKVMLVDDSAVLRYRLGELLGELSDVQVVAATGDSSLAPALAQAHHADVMIVDLHMPGRDGIATMRDVRAVAPALTAVMLTSFASPSFRRAAMEAGADFFFDKAEDLERLLDTLRLLARRKAG